LDTLEIREHGIVDAVGTTVLSLERADVLVALRSRRMVEFERACLGICIPTRRSFSGPSPERDADSELQQAELDDAATAPSR